MSASRQKKLRQEQAAAAPATKRPPVSEEQKAAKRLKLWSIVFYVVIGLMVLGILCAAVYNSGLPQRTLTAATVGSHKLTAAEVNFYFVDSVNNNAYLSYFVEAGVPLDEQEYQDGQTWADYVMDTAIQTARNTYAVYDAAIAAGFTMDDEMQAEVDEAIANMELYASIYGYSSVSAMIRANYGVGCNVSNYRHYLEVQQLASHYANHYYEELTYTQEDINAESEANPTDYNSYSYRYYLLSTSDYYETEADEHTEEETTAALAAAKEAADQMAVDCENNEEAFKAKVAELTATDTDETSEETEPQDTSLHTGELKSSISSTLADWITDASRQAGETTVIEAANDAGYYVVMYLSTDENRDVNTVNVRHILISTQDGTSEEDALAKIEDIQAQYEENPTEDNFAELANENSSDTGSNTNGGLYEGVMPGQMVAAFNDWCFDEARQPGDTGVVKTDYGYHLIYFVGQTEQTYRDAMIENTLKNNDYEAWYTATTEALSMDRSLALKMAKTNVTVQSNSSSN